MKSSEPFDGWPWAIAPAVIDHIAPRLDLDAVYDEIARRREVLACTWPRYSEDGEDGLICRWPRDDGGIIDPLRRAACVALKAALAKGKIRAKDPLGAPIELEWLKFAEISGGGSAVNLSSGRKLDHFEVCVEDVLRIWPLATPAEEPKEPTPDQADAPPVARKTATKLAQVTEALTRLWPDHNAPADRNLMITALEKELKRPISPKTLDRARETAGFPKLRQKSPNVV